MQNGIQSLNDANPFMTAPNPPLPEPRASRMTRRAWLLTAAGCVSASGCINFGAMMSKMVLGDPHVEAVFHQRTGVKLGKDHTVILCASAPVLVNDENSSLTFDVVQQMDRGSHSGTSTSSRRTRSRVPSTSAAVRGPLALAREFPEADYIIHIKFNGYGIKEPNSPNLYRGYAAGLAFAWAARGGGENGPRQAVQVFEQEFQIEHPKHPVSRDSMSLNAFEKAVCR